VDTLAFKYTVHPETQVKFRISFSLYEAILEVTGIGVQGREAGGCSPPLDRSRAQPLFFGQTPIFFRTKANSQNCINIRFVQRDEMPEILYFY